MVMRANQLLTVLINQKKRYVDIVVLDNNGMRQDKQVNIVGKTYGSQACSGNQ